MHWLVVKFSGHVLDEIKLVGNMVRESRLDLF